jgi:ribosomal protein S18 acetylase RimI-like enzyme
MIQSVVLRGVPYNQAVAIEIRPMAEQDLPNAVHAVLAGGWGDRTQSLAFAVRSPCMHPMVAEVDGQVVGTAIASVNGPVGWVGLIFTAPAWRGRGLGSRLTRATVARLGELGCRSCVLAATPLGRPIYERLGFQVVGEYSVLHGPPRPLPPDEPRLRPLRPADLPQVVALDRAASAEDRAHLLAALTDGWLLVDDDDERPSALGYAVRTPWGAVAAIAPRPAAGTLLLDVVRAQAADASEVTITVPTANHAAIDWLAQAGFTEQRRLPRMVLGQSVDWRPAHIWSIYSFALG